MESKAAPPQPKKRPDGIAASGREVREFQRMNRHQEHGRIQYAFALQRITYSMTFRQCVTIVPPLEQDSDDATGGVLDRRVVDCLHCPGKIPSGVRSPC
jgi:hypothetical protein